MFKIKPQVKKNLKEQIQKTRICVVGEIHGIKENVDFYKYLIKTFDFKSIALECPETYVNIMEDYLKGNESRNILTSSIPDGRISLEMLKMLKELLQENILQKIVYIDTYTPKNGKMDWNLRDKLMAETLIEYSKLKIPTLIIAGNMHTRKNSFIDTFSGKERIPMGVHLKNHFKDFPLIYIYYKKGTFYNFGVQELPKKDFENSLEILHKKNLDYYIWMEKATAIEFDNN